MTPFLFTDETRAKLRIELATHGFAATPEPALGRDLIDRLLGEADSQRPSGWGGPTARDVDHDVWRAELGPAACDFLASADTRRLMKEAFGTEAEPSWEASCFTYYDGPGSFMSRHRDRADSCAYTLIVYLRADWPAGAAPSAGLTLRIFAGGGGARALQLETRANTLVLGRGADVWHERPALAEGEHLVALTACFSRSALAAGGGGGPQRRSAAILVDEGTASWGRGDLAKAREQFDQGLALDPTNDAAWAGLGFVSWTEQHFQGALAAFTEAARHDGMVASHWSNIGLCLRDLGQPDRAMAAFEAALAIDPGYAPALNEWGNVYQDMGRPAQAVEHYSRALALDPSRAVVLHNMGVALLALGEHALALQSFLSALHREPGYSHSLEEVGILLMNSGQREAACDFLLRARSPRAADLLERLGAVDQHSPAEGE